MADVYHILSKKIYARVKRYKLYVHFLNKMMVLLGSDKQSCIFSCLNEEKVSEIQQHLTKNVSKAVCSG